MKRRVWVTAILAFSVFLLPQIGFSKIEYLTSFGGDIRGSAAYGDYAYFSQGNAIRIFNTHDKGKIHEVGAYRLKGEKIGRLAIKWPVLFYVWSAPGSVWENLKAIDVSDPAHPQSIKKDGDFASCKGELEWEIMGTHLVIQNGSGHGIYDISDPKKPKSLTATEKEKICGPITETPSTSLKNMPIMPRDIMFSGVIDKFKVTGNRVYVICGGETVEAIDVADPREPKYLGAVKDSAKIRSHLKTEDTHWSPKVYFNGKYEISINELVKEAIDNDDYSMDQIVIKDISNPVAPRMARKILDVYRSSLVRFDGLMISDSLLFASRHYHNSGGSNHSISVFDLKNIEGPRSPGIHPNGDEYDESIGEFPIRFDNPPDRIITCKDLIYVSDPINGLTILRMEKK